MEYIFGIVGVVLVGGLLLVFLYTAFSQKSSLDDVKLNAKEDRLYGNVDYDYDDDDRVEIFDDLIDFAKQAEDAEFERTVDEINKFVARRSAQEDVQNVDTVEQPVSQPVLQTQVVQQPVVQQSVQPVVQQQVPVQQAVAEERTMTTDELYKQINDDYIEEL